MTLEDAIRHCEEVAKQNMENAEVWKKVKPSNYPDEQTCEWAVKDRLKCFDEHRQLAEWLKELKTVQDIIKQHDKDSMPEDYWYIDKIRTVVLE